MEKIDVPKWNIKKTDDWHFLPYVFTEFVQKIRQMIKVLNNLIEHQKTKRKIGGALGGEDKQLSFFIR